MGNAADASQDDVNVDKKRDGDNFFAARGKKSDSSDDASSYDDFFWANRGKRAARIALRDQGSFNVPRPNGFFFPSAQGKRGLSRFLPKRSSFNLPRPNGFIFASKNQGKRSGSDDKQTMRNKIWNIAKPNGFFFPSIPVHPSKRFSGEASAEDGFDESQLYGLLSNIFTLQEGGQDNEIVKRDTLDESTFFAGRGKKSDDDLGAFYAGRGKKDSVDEDLAAFFAGRGKKGGEVGDIFFAGRG